MFAVARESWLDSVRFAEELLMTMARSRLANVVRVSHEVAGILSRLDSSAEFWEQRLKKIFARSRLLGSNFATDRQRLQDLAARRGVHHLDNLVTMPRSAG